jgi:hypothetical protein
MGLQVGRMANGWLVVVSCAVQKNYLGWHRAHLSLRAEWSFKPFVIGLLSIFS